MRPRRTCLHSSSWARELQRAGWLFELNGAEGVGGADGAFNSGDVRSIKVASLFSRCSLGPPLLWKNKRKRKKRKRRGEGGKKGATGQSGRQERKWWRRKKNRRSVLDLLAGTPVRRNCSSFFAYSANFGPWIPGHFSPSSAKRKVTVHSFFIISFDQPHFLVCMCISRINLRDKVENGTSPPLF